MTTGTETVEVTLGEHVLKVPEGGYYDRHRMEADLDEVEKDPAVPSVDFFRSLPKRVVESPIGPTSTPNFYYSATMAQIAMIAPIGAVRDRLPEGLEPLRPAPGLGLVVLSFYTYDVCDIDPYNEATVAIGIRPPRHSGPAELDFISGMRNGTLHGYSLSLPVTSEIARVRGYHGYGLPKWRTDIEVDYRTGFSGRVDNGQGDTDVAVEMPVPAQTSRRSGSDVRTTIAVSAIDGAWHESKAQFNVLSSGRSYLPRGVRIIRGAGRMSDDLESLRPIRPVTVDVMTSGQIALNMPVPTSIPTSHA